MQWQRALIVPALGAALLLPLVGGPASAATTTGTATTTVNIRSGPGVQHAIVGGLERGQRITVTGRSTGNWLKVRFDRQTAYLSGQYVKTSGAVPAAPRALDPAGVKLTTATLNVRSGPGLEHSVVGTLAEGTRVVLSGAFSGGFAQTTVSGRKRWVSAQYLARLAGSVANHAPSARGVAALAFAKRQLGKPYGYGAEGPKAYDCSGLVQAAWASAGVSLPRVTTQQFRAGTRITKSQLRLGDLVFFYGPRPSHVGIYAGSGQIIHAPRPGKTVQYTKVSSMPYAGAVRPG